MPNTLLTPTIIAKEALMQLKNNCVMGANVHRTFKKEFVKIGETVSIRKPVKFEVNDGADVSNQLQDITEESTSITISQHKNVAWPWSLKDQTLTIEKFSERYITPAMIAIANVIDNDLTGLYKDVFNGAGTPGTTPNSFATFGAVSRKLDEGAVPRNDRRLVLNPAANWEMADALKGTFDRELAKDTIRAGYLGTIAGLDILEDQNIRRHTAGSLSGTPLIDTVSNVTYSTTQSNGYSTVHTDGYTGTVLQGDTFTIAGVYAVNPLSKETLTSLQQFTVIEEKEASTDTPLKVSPMIITSGAYQTVSAAPADGAAITFSASHAANLAFNKNAFALVTVPFESVGKGRGVEMVTMEYDGLTITVTRGFSIEKFKNIIRLDIMYGYKTIYPELACRMYGE